MRIKRDVQAVIFDDRDGSPRFLLICKRDAASERCDWRLVKGGVEDGESEAEALLREIAEETGLKRVQIIEKISNYEFSFRGVKHLVSSYLVRADSREEVRISHEKERRPITGYMWADYKTAVRSLRWREEKRSLRLGIARIKGSLRTF